MEELRKVATGFGCSSAHAHSQNWAEALLALAGE
jgi:hypothetical protein